MTIGFGGGESVSPTQLLLSLSKWGGEPVMTWDEEGFGKIMENEISLEPSPKLKICFSIKKTLKIIKF